MRVDDRKLVNWLVSGAVVLALLVYGQPLLVPLAFALVLWAILNALTDLLRRWRFPAWLAWLASFALIGAALCFVALVLANEAAALAAQIPNYATKLQQSWTAWFPFARKLPMLDFATLIRQANLPGLLGGAAASVGTTMLELVLVVIFVGFLLAEQRRLPAKLARLRGAAAGKDEGGRVIHAIGRQIRHYLGVCTLLSAAMGAVCYAVLILLGVSFAGFWALVLFLLTYIPTVGGVGVGLPALMALAQFPTPGPAIIIVVVLGLAHFFLTNVIEPIALGRSLNLSPLAIILALTFWGLIWGVSGLFLAVPITGAIGIACRHIEGLGWIAELIAGPPPGEPRWRLFRPAGRRGSSR
jgi:AI-2 transport protein TqsA